ncbi:hypothetical protein [Legionella genomosp. 1]|uniref:hypothetical protein n=1 Tax=Legionella genomosp. 1 TaxID=1093625 RepID=UPI00105466D5|nr:hypothetical protein [Legionella genomosp. 1]
MYVVMRRLPQVVQLEPSITLEGTKIWQTADFSDRPQAFYESLVEEHLALTLEYSILCTQLAREFMLRPDSPEFTKQLEAALIYAELLEYLFRNYINVPREVLRLRKEQAVYRYYLEKRGYYFEPQPVDLELKADTFTQKMRNDTAWVNPFRLIFIRSKRLLNALVPVLSQIDQYAKAMATVDKVLNPALAYLGWIFFAPRLFSNLFLLFKHSVPAFMTEQEKNLGFWFRFLAQLKRRYFEIGNDVIWFTAGVLNCFVFVGPLAPIGVYFSLACFIYDIIWAGIRAGIEIHRFNQLKAKYAEMADEIKDDDSRYEEYQALLRHQKILDFRIEIETRRVLTTIATTAGVCLGFILMLPFFMANPVIPLIGAMIFLSATVAGFLATRYFEELRPQDQLQLPAKEKPSITSSPLLFFNSVNKNEQDGHYNDTLLTQPVFQLT